MMYYFSCKASLFVVVTAAVLLLWLPQHSLAEPLVPPVASSLSSSSLTTFPLPSDHVACHNEATSTSASRVCDINGLLSPQEIRQLEVAISHLEAMNNVTCHDDVLGVQMGIYIVDVMQQTHRPGTNLETLAQQTAMAIHNQWGIGYQSECGGTGLLLFLAVGDHQMYMSRGKALHRVLTDDRLQYTLEKMKPDLREYHYASALRTAIHLTSEFLQGHHPGAEETKHGLVVLSLAILLLSAVSACHVAWKKRRDQRLAQMDQAFRYDLTKLDRYKAQSKQGKYQATSCPICLEDFCQHVNTPESGGGGTYETKPLASYSDNDTVHSPESGSTAMPGVLGSDGLPVQLLVCGHVFDQGCWNQWVQQQQQQGIELVCPICRHAVYGNEGAATYHQTRSVRRSHIPYWNATTYHDEYRFRLQQLMTRYPSTFLGTQYVSEWMMTTTSGREGDDRDSLLDDYVRREQVRAAEAIAVAQHSDNNTSTNSGFGGGSADGGGVGASW